MRYLILSILIYFILKENLVFAANIDSILGQLDKDYSNEFMEVKKDSLIFLPEPNLEKEGNSWVKLRNRH